MEFIATHHRAVISLMALFIGLMGLIARHKFHGRENASKLKDREIAHENRVYRRALEEREKMETYKARVSKSLAKIKDELGQKTKEIEYLSDRCNKLSDLVITLNDSCKESVSISSHALGSVEAMILHRSSK